MKTKLFPVILREIAGQPVQTVAMNFNDKANQVGEACVCCGKRIAEGSNLFAHYAIAGYWIPFDSFQDDCSISQGCFAIGPECAKRFPKEFVGSL
jgi:hypothetical protein